MSARRKNPGRLIVMEGIDGCGKTTQARRLTRALEVQQRKVVHTREPGGTALGEKLRALMLDPENTIACARTDALLMAAARSEHVEQVIRPALNRGWDVVCERFSTSTIVYQGSLGGIESDALEAVCAFAQAGITPYVTIVVDIDPEEAAKRRHSRTEDRIEKDTAAQTRELRIAYLALRTRRHDDPCSGPVVVVSGTGNEDEVHSRISKVVRPS